MSSRRSIAIHKRGFPFRPASRLQSCYRLGVVNFIGLGCKRGRGFCATITPIGAAARVTLILLLDEEFGHADPHRPRRFKLEFTL
jgi:hypothetical protein